jgi:two-component system sporulation sensor kinase A
MKGELKILSDALVSMRQNIADNQKEKEKILAQIAHEIRNPLGGIELLSSLIYESVENNSKHKEYSGKILKEITGLKELITSYLNFSRTAPAMPEEINIPGIVEETLSYLQNDIEKLNIAVQKDFQLKKITFDKIHFRNILLNLLKNSIESINANGGIMIYSGREKNRSIIQIRDNGGGIPEEIIEKIFDPFFTTKSNGTGLGLAACRKFCEENGALLSAENISHGSVFTIKKES